MARGHSKFTTLGNSMIRYLLFDLDDTLYLDTSGLFLEVRQRIEAWLARALGVTPEMAHTLRREYHARYGTTMSGLLYHHPEVDVEDYLEDVHRVDVARYLAPAPALGAMLARLPAAKVIFTNAIASWAEQILTCMDIREHFERIVDVRDLRYLAKPRPEAYAQVLTLLQAKGSECVLLDDQRPNLQGATLFGIRTILVRPDGVPGDGAEFAAPTVLDAEPVLWRLLEGAA